MKTVASIEISPTEPTELGTLHRCRGVQLEQLESKPDDKICADSRRLS